MTRAPFLINIAFITILSDVVLNYFLENFYTRLPVLAVIPVLLFFYILFNDNELRKLKSIYYFYIYIGFIGYSIGLASIDKVPSNRFFEIITAYSAWMVGFLWMMRSEKNKEDKWRTVLYVTSIHALLCFAALIKVAPHYFPIKTSLWALNRELHERPEITTDQNFQIFYFLPIVGLLLFYRNLNQALLSLIALALSAYALSAIQTRSGLLVLVGAIVSGLVFHIICKGGQKGKAIALITLIFCMAFSVVVYKYDAVSLIIIRFTEENYQTGYGRLHGLLYFFEKVWNPLWWIPRGNDEYKAIAGVIPHSNLTAHLLDGGILGVFSWMGLIVAPTLKLYILQLQRPLVRDSAIASVISLSALVAQLSLNAAFMDLLWMYGGMTSAALLKLRQSK